MFLQFVKTLRSSNFARIIQIYPKGISYHLPFTRIGKSCLEKYYSNQFYRKLLPFSSNTQQRVSIYSSASKWKSIPSVDYLEIKDILNQPQKLLIDVREPMELKEMGEIPSSINIPLGNVAQELGPGVSATEFEAKYGRKKPHPDTVIIFSCLKGKRSLQAAELAVSLGFKNVKNYLGSWEDWALREGLPK